MEQPHLQPWATALRAQTTRGPVWLKAAGPGTAFEVGLYELLHRCAPDEILEPIAADPRRGWIVLPDGGTPLGERFAGTELLDAMAAALPRYGELQRALARHADELVALGVTGMRPAAMPRRLEQALVVVGDGVGRCDGGTEGAVLARVAALRDDVARWCERLADGPGPPSIDHNDLHPWNVLVGDAGDARRMRFYDWGDSVVAHPFSSMLVGLGFMQRHVLDCRLDDPRLVRLRDAYLEPFGDLGSHRELVETLELACRVGKIARALTWHRAVAALRAGDVEQAWLCAPFEALRSLLDASYLGVP